MNKQINKLLYRQLIKLLTIIMILFSLKTNAQSSCATAAPFCANNGSVNFPAGVNNGTGEIGPDYDCLFTQPNPAWYYMQVSQSGNIIIDIAGSGGRDVDFICWGPFNSSTGNCGNLTSSNTIDCSFSTSPIETCTINNAIAGQYYMLLITNYSNQAQNIVFSQGGGTGQLNCNIVNPPSVFVANVQSQDVCKGTPTTLNVVTNIPTPQFLWQPGGLTTQNIVVNPLVNTVYQVTVTNSGGASITSTAQITVYDPPTAAFTSNTVCLNNPTNFIDASLGNGYPIIDYGWDFNNDLFIDLQGTTNTNYTLPLEGNQLVSYEVSTSPVAGLTCTHKVSQNVFVNPLPKAAFSFVNSCINTQPSLLDASVSQISSGTIDNYLWDFGDGQTLNGTTILVNHNYTSTGLYQVSITETSNNSCVASITHQIEVYKKPLLSVTSNTVCFSKQTNVNALSLPSSGNVVIWNWDFNNTPNTIEATGSATDFVFPTEGVLQQCNLVAITDHGCKDVFPFTVYTKFLPNPDFKSDTTYGCPFLCVKFKDLTQPMAAPDVNVAWKWVFGDGGINNQAVSGAQVKNCYNNLSPFNNMEYDVTLIVTASNGCVDSLVKRNHIKVYPKPLAQYTITPMSGDILVPQFEFTNQSVGYTNWYWNFGDGSNIDSTTVEPVYEYNTVNTISYPSQLIVYNSLGCKDTADVVINVAPAFAFYVPNAFTPNENGLNDVFMGKGMGIDSYEMLIFDRWGASVFNSNDLNVGWDGTYKGKLAKQDVYTWKVSLMDVFKKGHEYTGHVTLIR